MNRIEPALLSKIRRYGTFDAQGCYNCGSCTVSCDLTSSEAPFPRRPMQFALVGLKQNLRGSLEPWLCHDCGDCSTTCPRGAEPRESMMTLRRWLTSQYDWTGLSARIFASKVWGIGALLFMCLLFLGLVVVYHLYVDADVKGIAFKDFVSMPMPLQHMFGVMTWFTRVLFLIPLALMSTFALRMYFFSMGGSNPTRAPLKTYLSKLNVFFTHLFLQPKIKECPQPMHRRRWKFHFLLIAGFCLMVLVKFFFLSWFQTDTVHPFYHPQRWLGYLAAIALLTGSVDILIGRFRKKDEIHKFSELSDWTFPLLILLTGLSGMLVHIARLSGLDLTTHVAYALHVMFVVAMVMVELPFGRWAHGIYRPLALYFQAVKEEVRKGGQKEKEQAA